MIDAGPGNGQLELGFDVDDIGDLSLAALTLDAGAAVDVGQWNSLTVGALTFEPSAFEVHVDAGATLTIAGSVSGSGGLIVTSGTVLDAAASDPGEDYQVDNGGEVVLTAAPNKTSTLDYGFGAGAADAGIGSFCD